MIETDNLKIFGGSQIGWLSVLEFSTLPFVPVRMFMITGVQEHGIRGRHAHKETQQYLICLQGQVFVSFIKEDLSIETISLIAYQGVFIDKGVFAAQRYVDNAKLLVLASTIYNRSDYIEDFEEWKAWKKNST